MNDNLLNVKLKKTDVKEKTYDLKHELFLEKSQNSRLRDVDIESWYHKVEKYTYPTEFVDLTISEAQAIVEEYRNLKHDSTADWTKNQTLILLQDKLERILKSSSMEEVFVKLSSRSPKDSKICQSKAKRLALDRLEALKQQRSITTNDLVVAIMTTGIEALKMKSAKEILETFLTSDRVCEDDLPLALQFPERWSQHIVIRRWISIPIQYEFRAFVYGNKLTALSQYFNNAYFPEVVEKKEKIQKLVFDLFESVKDLLNINPAEYVLDIAVQMDQEKAYVIELNPFGKPDGMGTGTCLFNNSKEEDLKVLFGEKAFEFRVEQEATTIDAKKYIRGEWRTFFMEHGFIS